CGPPSRRPTCGVRSSGSGSSASTPSRTPAATRASRSHSWMPTATGSCSAASTPGRARGSTPRPSTAAGPRPLSPKRRRRRSEARWPAALHERRARPDRLGGTAAPDAPDMAPNAPMTRPRVRREPPPLDQLPAWGEFVPVMDTPATEDPVGLDALLGGLNPDQFRAVTHGAGPLLIVAGAGTGKTQVSTRRIAWLIATRRAHPSEILALTFTDKAAEEM